MMLKLYNIMSKVIVNEVSEQVGLLENNGQKRRRRKMRRRWGNLPKGT